MLTLEESSYVVDAKHDIGGKNKVTRVTWFSFGTLHLWLGRLESIAPLPQLTTAPVREGFVFTGKC